MSILYIITQADGGGAQKYVLTLAKHFGGIIAAGTEAQNLFDDASRLQLTTYNLQHLKRNIHPWHDILAIFEIRDLIKKIRPDIVHLNSSKAGFLGSLAAMFLKTRVVFTAHGFIFNEPMPKCKKAFYLALEKIASDFRNFIITVSEADKKSALNNKLIDANKIQTIHNGLAPINFLSADEAKTKLGLNKSKFIIGTVTGFYKTKGLDVLIKAVSKIEKNIQSNIQVILIGDGPELLNLKSEILNLKLERVILTPGKIENGSAYLKAFDLFILPSRKEGFSFALLEAMQAALPIIATDVGGNSEALGDAGAMVNPEDPKALAEAITSLIKDEPKRNTFSQKALERSKVFTEEKMLEETKAVYEKLLQKK